MGYTNQLQNNNENLQIIINAINAMSGGNILDTSNFVPTNSGKNTFKSRTKDNNIDLENILAMITQLPEVEKDLSFLIDFRYIDNGNDTYSLVGWKKTLNGEPSTEMVIPDDSRIIL